MQLVPVFHILREHFAFHIDQNLSNVVSLRNQSKRIFDFTSAKYQASRNTKANILNELLL